MSGFNKKLSLTISKEEVMNLMIFSNDLEKVRASKYLDLKGVVYHVILINIIGLDEEGRVKYKLVSDVYKYDKRLRNKLYKFTSAFEERLRAFIANDYKLSYLPKRLQNKINDGSNIAFELEETTFNEVIKIIKRFPNGKLKKLFPNKDEYLFDNLKAVRDLRNIISHHKILLSYEDYSECYIDGIEYSDLRSNIINLVNLIDVFYKDFLVKEINESIIDDEDDSFYLPERFVVQI